jgi:hypothetical protein
MGYTKKKSKAQIAAEVAAYRASTKMTGVKPADLKPGMIMVRSNGARYEINTVGQDMRNIFVNSIKLWASRGLPTDGATCFTATPRDIFGLPGMDIEAEIGENIWVVRPDAADCYYDIESDSIN